MSPSTNIDLHLPTLHAKQLEIKGHPANRKVICAGRRVGKTTLLADVATRAFLEGRQVLYAVPVADQAASFWGYVTTWLEPLIGVGQIYKNEGTRFLKMRRGTGELHARTAWDADSLRSTSADELMLDEFPLMDPSTWDEVGAPMMLDTNGRTWFVGTPKRKNHFFHFYQRGQADGERWKSWQFASHENPHLSKEALDDMTVDMTEAAYQQEILAQFLEGEGTVFRGLDAVMNAPRTTPEEHEGHRLVMGIDWGEINDFSAWSIGCKECGHEIAHDRFRRMDYTRQRARVVAAVQKWGVKRIIPEENNVGRAIIAELRREPGMSGVRIEPFKTNSDSKPPLIDSLALGIETGQFQWLASPVWTTELEAYEVKYSRHGNPQYSAPQGVNDDTVMARALMWRGVTRVRTWKFASV